MLVYYLIAAFLTLAGMVCYFGVGKHPIGKLFFKKKDAQLIVDHHLDMARKSEKSALLGSAQHSINASPVASRHHSPPPPRANALALGDAGGAAGAWDGTSASDSRARTAQGGHGARGDGGWDSDDGDEESDDSASEHAALLAAAPERKCKRSAHLPVPSTPPTPASPVWRRGSGKALLTSSSSSTASLETQLQSSRYTNMQMLLMCWREMLAQLLMTVCSTLVASLYIKFEPTKYDDLPTLLL